MAARYQASWNQLKFKQEEKVVGELNQVNRSNSSRNTGTNNNCHKKVSFQGLNHQSHDKNTKEDSKSVKNSNQSHKRLAKTKQQQESQTKHPNTKSPSRAKRATLASFPPTVPQQTKPISTSTSASTATSTPIAKPAVPVSAAAVTATTTTIARRRPRKPFPIAKTQAKAKSSTRTRTTRTKMVDATESSASSSASSSSGSNNVSVVVRLRPVVPHETKRGAQKVVHKVRTIDAVLNAGGTKDQYEEEVVRVELAPSLAAKSSNNRELVKCFALDGVLEEHDSQEDVYKKSGAYKAISQDLFRGFHCTILAYGQSGSGKTFTMGTMANKPQTTSTSASFTAMGSEMLDPEAGVIQRACHDLFQQVEEQCMGDATVELSYLEIYNEELRDLLSPQTTKLSHGTALRQQKERERLAQQEGLPLSPGGGGGASSNGLAIREDNGEVFVQGKTSVAVTNAEQVIELLRLANAKRVVASTKLNDVSSRSHAICILTVTGTNSYDVTFQSRLTLVDLAGSERLSKTENTGWRAKEGININVGLFVLGLVISALTETRPAHKRHPPYRESKLTRILQNSLGGNCRTIMIACCSPTDYHCEETVNTLRYATQARNIENPVVANIVHDEHAEQILHLQSEKDALAKTNSTLQEQIAEYELLIRQISSELTHVKQHYQNTTQELTEVKQDYQTTAEQLMEIQEDFKLTVDQLKKEKIEDVLKKQTRRQKRLSSGEYLNDNVFGVDDDEPLLLVNTPTRSIHSAFGENSIGTEPTADLTIGTMAALTPEAKNRLVPPPTLQDEDADADATQEELEEIGEASVPEQQQEPTNEPEEDPSAAADEEESVPVSQVAPEECDQSQAISLLTEHQEWNAGENNPLLGDMEQQQQQQDTDSVSLSKALEQAAASQDLDDQTKELQQQLEEDTSALGAANSLLADHPQNHNTNEESSLTTEIHEPLSTNYIPEEEKKESEEDKACDSSYQKCKTNALYCNGTLVDKESEVMVEAIPLGMDDLTGVSMPPSTTTSSKSVPSTPKQSKSKGDLHSLQSGTITQGSQATSASGKRKSAFKQFLAKWNCMSGAYGMVNTTTTTTTNNNNQKMTKTTTKQQQPQATRN